MDFAIDFGEVKKTLFNAKKMPLGDVICVSALQLPQNVLMVVIIKESVPYYQIYFIQFPCHLLKVFLNDQNK